MSPNLMIIISTALATMCTILFFCYFGERATESFENMSDLLYETIWPDLPTNIQKDFIIMMANMQRPIHYHGFNVFILSLKTFVAVRSKLLITF